MIKTCWLCGGTINKVTADKLGTPITEIGLIKTLKDCGVENPIKSFQIEILVSDNANEYHAVVLRINDKKETAK